MATNKVAETAKEFYEKYKGKRFTAYNGGLIYILEYAFQTFKLKELNEKKNLAGNPFYHGEPLHDEQPESLPENLYSPERTEKVLSRVYDSGVNANIGLAVGMRELTHWLVTANDSATSQFHIASLLFIAIDYNELRSYTVKNTLGNEFTHALDHKYSGDLSSIADFIAYTLRYCVAYNTLIQSIADFTQIPELSVFEVKGAYGTAKDLTISLILKELHADETDIRIPEDNLKSLSENIKEACNGAMPWSVIFRYLLTGYWAPTQGGASIGNG